MKTKEKTQRKELIGSRIKEIYLHFSRLFYLDWVVESLVIVKLGSTVGKESIHRSELSNL